MISIVVPCYNCAATIRHTARTIQDQTLAGYQIVMVDDGSTDDTGNICDELARSDDRIKVIHQTNGGLMNAWKEGVRAATGEYIVFCDSDDRIDDDLIEHLEDVIGSYNADVILYSMILEYENEDRVPCKHELPAGFYDHDELCKSILPKLYHNGGFRSALILPSRCSKAIRRDLLLSVMDELPDEVGEGEDGLTTFAVMTNARSVFCMGDYAPYIYVRRNTTMAGAYDPYALDKIHLCNNHLYRLAERYGFPYMDQIDNVCFTDLILCMKKMISRNTEGYHRLKAILEEEIHSVDFMELSSRVSTAGYGIGAKGFTWMIVHGWIWPAYVIIRFVDTIIGRRA